MLEKSLTDSQKNWLEAKEKIRIACEKSGRENNVRLMAVTKTVSTEKVNEIIDIGCNLIGENRVQELLEKYESYDKRAEIHFIGTLQKNKVKYIVDKVSMIESVDSLKLAKEIDKRSEAIGKTMDILLEINIAEEDNKSGFLFSEIESVLPEINHLEHIRVCGFMTIGKANAKIEETDAYFKKMSALLVDISQKKLHNNSISVLSMGMSSDYELAVTNGATIVRIGRGLFGERKNVIQF